MKTELRAAITQLSAERNLPKEVVLAVLESALASAYKKDTGALEQDIVVKVDPNTGEINFYAQKVAVDTVANPDLEISIDDAHKLRAGAQIGDTVSIECTPRNIGRIAAQAAKQVVLQRLREAEQRIVCEEFTGREGDIVAGVVHFMEPQRIYVRLSRTEAILPSDEQVPTERYHKGQRLRFYLLDIAQGSRGPQIILSRSHPHFIRRLFELEIPEVHSGLVELKALAREAGHRTKVAVASSQENTDPVGCCLGPRGIRLQSILKELRGEKIDVIQWHSDPAVFIANALSPAQVVSTNIDQARRAATVVVPDKQLSLAIGKEGQNARLAARLTGWRFDIKSVSAVEAEKSLLPEPEAEAETILPEIEELEPIKEKEAEEPGLEESVELDSMFEAPAQETHEEKQIRFAEEILRDALKSETTDKAKSATKGKGKSTRHRKKADDLWSDELEE